MTAFNGPRCAALMRASMDALRISQLGRQMGDLLDDLVNTSDPLDETPRKRLADRLVEIDFALGDLKARIKDLP